MNKALSVTLFVGLVLSLITSDAQAGKRPPRRRARPGVELLPPPPPRHVPPRLQVAYVPAPAPRAIVVAEDPRPAPRAAFVAPYIGVAGSASTVASGQGSLRNPGGGVDAFLGFDLGSRAGLELSWSSSFRSGEGLRSAIHSIATEGKVFALQAGSMVRPYLSLGAGALFFYPDLDFPRMVGGPMLTAGLGIDLNVGSHVFLGAKVSWKGMYIDDAMAVGISHQETAFLNDLGGAIRLGFRF